MLVFSDTQSRLDHTRSDLAPEPQSDQSGDWPETGLPPAASPRYASRQLRFVEERNETIRWAQAVVRQPTKGLILETEASSYPRSELIAVSIVRVTGELLFSSLVRAEGEIQQAQEGPTSRRIDTSSAPRFSEIHAILRDLLEGQPVYGHNLEFSRWTLDYSCRLAGLPLIVLSPESQCLMMRYSSFLGEEASSDTYLWDQLEGIHRFRGECEYGRHLLIEMASARQCPLEESFTSLDRYYLH